MELCPKNTSPGGVITSTKWPTPTTARKTTPQVIRPFAHLTETHVFRWT